MLSSNNQKGSPPTSPVSAAGFSSEVPTFKLPDEQKKKADLLLLICRVLTVGQLCSSLLVLILFLLSGQALLLIIVGSNLIVLGSYYSGLRLTRKQHYNRAAQLIIGSTFGSLIMDYWLVGTKIQVLPALLIVIIMAVLLMRVREAVFITGIVVVLNTLLFILQDLAKVYTPPLRLGDEFTAALNMVATGIVVPVAVMLVLIPLQNLFRLSQAQNQQLQIVLLEREKALAALASDIAQRNQTEAQLRESESKYRMLMEQAADSIFISDANGNYLDVNSKACEMLGYSREELIQLNSRELVLEEDFLESKAYFKEVEAGKITLTSKRLRRKDGAVVEVEVNAKVLEDGRVQAIVRDITERLKLEQELIKIQKLESVGRLAGGIAHDFNNILTGVVGYLTLATEEAAKQGQSELAARLGEAEQATYRAKELTQQLLTFSKGGAPVKKLISLNPLLEETVGRALRDSKLRPVFELAPALWPVEIDEGQFVQVINNLVINAEQALPQGGKLVIKAENLVERANLKLALPNKTDYIKLSFQDNGPGIPEAQLQHIFDPYFSTRSEGSGLGLAVAFSIVRQHDGFLTCESAPGKGSCFSIYLPRSSKPMVKPPTVARPAPLSGCGGRVLVMDDEPMIRSLIKKVLEARGYQVDEAGEGGEALTLYHQAQAEARPYALILMDLTIPGGMGGKEAIQALRKLDSQVKVIVSSGYSNDPIIAHHREYGFTATLNKPFRLQELIEKVEEVLGLARTL